MHRILVIAQRPAENQRERDDANLRDVGAMIEMRRPRRSWQRDAEVFPVLLVREAKLLERRAHHVFDDDEPRVRADDDALRRNRAVRGVSRVLVQHGHRRHKLPDQAQRRVDVEREVRELGNCDQIRQAHARRVLGHERQGRSLIVQSIDAANAREIGMAEVREAAHTLAQRELERGNRGELASQAEDFERLIGGVDHMAPFAEAILKHDACRRACRGTGSHSWIHTILSA